jgi:signal transduction histidine kinase/DNA-binding NarL/FixJ family response regulator
MKYRIGYFFWILALAFGLMILIVAAQVLTKRNIAGLKKGNSDAALTFTINNRLQEMVNLCFELNTKTTNQSNPPYKRQSLVDSLNTLGYNISVLEKLGLTEETKTEFSKLNKYIGQQVERGLQILEIEKIEDRSIAAASLRKEQVADSVYAVALTIQKFLERDLSTTLNNNTSTSTRLSSLNKTLALIAIAAILILCAIIINRHLRQVHLIAELEKATAAAKQSALVKEQFLANMSHEIRTPLNAINGFTRLMSQTPMGGKQKEYTRIINEASSNLLNIVNDILDISKIEASKLRIEKREFDLGKLMKSIEEMFSNSAVEKGLQYNQQIAPGIPTFIKGDPDRLSQILINLISNGIKFTHYGSVSVVVSAQKNEDEQIWIEFLVTDTGIGIPDDKKEIIFQRFEQLEAMSSEILQGTGLGLSIVKSLTEMMNGSVSVSGKPGSGSAFSVILPFEKATEGNISNTTDAKNDTAATYSGYSVLVVEDNKINQLLFESTLASMDIHVVVVSNGQEALNALSTKNYDLVFLDIQMPVMNGYETASKIRAGQLKTPLVAMTAFVLPGEREKCLQAGMDDYLAKPIDFSKLADVLKKFLKGENNNGQQGLSGKTVDTNELMLLVGGDSQIVKRIVKEISNEIPGIVQRLTDMIVTNDYAELKSSCHHMVSTFFPLGNENEVVKCISELSNNNLTGQEAKVAVLNLVDKIDGLHKDLKFTSNSLE